MKGRKIPVVPQDKALKQLNMNHMGIQRIRLLTHESIYTENMKTYRRNSKICPFARPFKQHDQKLKQCHMKYQGGCGNL